MFNIESENIVGTNFITIINKLFDDSEDDKDSLF
jgi:hypothetical protein